MSKHRHIEGREREREREREKYTLHVKEKHTSRQQQLYDVNMPASGSRMQRGSLLHVVRIWRRASIQQQLTHVSVAHACGLVQ